MVVSDCGTTLGAVRGVVGKLCTTLLSVGVKHATALGEDAGRFGGDFYSEFALIAEMETSTLTARPL